MSRDRRRNASRVEDYIGDLDASIITGSWEPAGSWHRVHGDGKSTTGGKFHMESMKTTGGEYKLKIVGSTVMLTYPEEPSWEQIVADLQNL